MRSMYGILSPKQDAICVATNQEVVRCYKLWNKKTVTQLISGQRLKYGSSLLNMEEGIEDSREIIR